MHPREVLKLSRAKQSQQVSFLVKVPRSPLEVLRYPRKKALGYEARTMMKRPMILLYFQMKILTSLAFLYEWFQIGHYLGQASQLHPQLLPKECTKSDGLAKPEHRHLRPTYH